MIKERFVTQLEKSQVKGQGRMALSLGEIPQTEKQMHKSLFIKGKFKRSSKKILVLVVRGAEQVSPLRMMQEA